MEDLTVEEDLTLVTKLSAQDAVDDIAKAVSARHTLARKYVMRMRRRNPDAAPAELIALLGKHYATSISTAGAMMQVGTVAAEIGISLIPLGGAAAAGAKGAGKAAAKSLVKSAAVGGAKKGLVKAIPAGDEQLKFEITAIYALAIAEIHGMQLDKSQAEALVHGLTNGNISQVSIAQFAQSLVHEESAEELIRLNAEGRSSWAATLSSGLPEGGARQLVSAMQGETVDGIRSGLSDANRNVVDGGIAAVSAGMARFVFGKQVVEAVALAFPVPPETFPPHLVTITKAKEGEYEEMEKVKAFAALEDAARSTGVWFNGTVSAAGGGIAKGATAVGANVSKATRVFRSVDLDGDGIPDEAQALTAMKGLGSALAGAADNAGSSVGNLFKKKEKDVTQESTVEETGAPSTEPAAGKKMRGLFKAKKQSQVDLEDDGA